jgi:hypothetical protein
MEDNMKTKTVKTVTTKGRVRRGRKPLPVGHMTAFKTGLEIIRHVMTMSIPAQRAWIKANEEWIPNELFGFYHTLTVRHIEHGVCKRAGVCADVTKLTRN